MSYVGGKYEFDLFISYSHGTASTDPAHKRKAKTLRDWSRSLADKLADNLSIALNAEEDDAAFSYFLDEREFDSGEPITEVIREAAAKSSVLLVLASPYYFRSSYCLAEIDAFFLQAGEDGRGLEHCVIRQILPTREEDWPAQLRGPDGRVVNRGEALFDPETELPIDIDAFREGGKMPSLAMPMAKLTMAIGKKLKDLRRQIEASELQKKLDDEEKAQAEALIVAQPGGGASESEFDPDLERKCIYLQTDCDNLVAWQRVKGELSHLFLVNPSELKGVGAESASGAGTASLLATYEARRRDMLRFCNGLVLLRAKPDDDMELQLMAARYDRATLKQEYGRGIPWALVDEVGDKELALPDVKIRRIPTNLPDWPERVAGALGFSSPAPA